MSGELLRRVPSCVSHHFACACREDMFAQRERLLRAEIERLTRALEEREHDMHMRIRANYDAAVAESWRRANARLSLWLACAVEVIEEVERDLAAANARLRADVERRRWAAVCARKPEEGVMGRKG